MSPQNEDMDATRLAAITADAVSNILFFHTKQITPPTEIRRAGLENAIDAVFHLRSHAADIAVAHLEIACDAAMSYAYEYNELHPHASIRPRWMYACVQALLTDQLKPALLDGSKIERLLDWVAQQKGELATNHSSNPGLDEGSTPSSVEQLAPTSPSQQSSESDMAVTPADDDDDDDLEDVSSFGQPANAGLVGGVMKATKTPWTDREIRRLIELRAQGLTHLQTADLLNRGQGAVENKYGRVVKEATWKPYVAQCAARFIKVRQGKRKGLCKMDGEEEADEKEEVARQPVAKKRRITLAAAAGFE